MSYKFDSVFLIAPIKQVSRDEIGEYRQILFNNITVKSLPCYKSYINAIPYFYEFVKNIIQTVPSPDIFIAEFLTPFRGYQEY